MEFKPVSSYQLPSPRLVNSGTLLRASFPEEGLAGIALISVAMEIRNAVLPATTSIYAPYETRFLSDAVEAIESVMREVPTHLKHAQIDRPEVDAAEAANTSLTTHRRGVGETKREEVRFLIFAGLPHAEVVRRSGVSSGTVSSIGQKSKAQMPFYRNTESAVCVPNSQSRGRCDSSSH
jgi:hypothetical protein